MSKLLAVLLCFLLPVPGFGGFRTDEIVTSSATISGDLIVGQIVDGLDINRKVPHSIGDIIDLSMNGEYSFFGPQLAVIGRVRSEITGVNLGDGHPYGRMSFWSASQVSGTPSPFISILPDTNLIEFNSIQLGPGGYFGITDPAEQVPMAIEFVPGISTGTITYNGVDEEFTISTDTVFEGKVILPRLGEISFFAEGSDFATISRVTGDFTITANNVTSTDDLVVKADVSAFQSSMTVSGPADFHNNVLMPSDSTVIGLGANALTAPDATMGFDGNSLNLVANAVTAGDTMNLTAASFQFNASPVANTFIGAQLAATDDIAFNMDGITNDYTGTGGAYKYAMTFRRDLNAGDGNYPTSFVAGRFVVYPKHTDAVIDAGGIVNEGVLGEVANSGTWSLDGDVNRTVTFRGSDSNVADTGTYDNTGTALLTMYATASRGFLNLDQTFSDTSTSLNRVYATGLEASVNNNPTLSTGELTVHNRGMSVDVVGTTIGSQYNYGIYITRVTGADGNWGIYDASGADWILDGDSQKIFWGEGQDASIEFDGNSLNIVANTITGTDDIVITADNFTVEADGDVTANRGYFNNDTFGIGAINLGGIQPSIQMLNTRPDAGGAATRLFNIQGQKTGETAYLWGEVGVLGVIDTVSTATYMYFGTETNVAYDENTLRLYPDKRTTMEGDTGVGNLMAHAAFTDEGTYTTRLRVGYEGTASATQQSALQILGRQGTTTTGDICAIEFISTRDNNVVGKISARRDGSISSGALDFYTAIDAGGLTLKATITEAGILRVLNKISFTQVDDNEYIDSLNDGYMDYGATTAHRFNTPVRGVTSLWWRIQNIDLSALPATGAVGAIYTPQSANNLNGYQLDNNPSEEYLYFNTHVGTDWDAASDLQVFVQFETNADNSVGLTTDTVNFDLVMYYKGNEETAQKTQDLDASVIVGQAAQYYHEQAMFTIDYDKVDHVVQAGDCVSFQLHLNTTDSEVDNVIVHHAMFRYGTNKVRAEQ